VAINHLIRGVVEHVNRGRRIGKYLDEFLRVPGLKGVVGGIANGFVFVGGETDQDLNLLVDRE
jgi:hypothetical protein